MVNHTSEEREAPQPWGRSVCNWECEHTQIHRHTLRAHQTIPGSLTSRVKTITHGRQWKCDTRETLSLSVRCLLPLYSLSDKYCLNGGKCFLDLASSNLIGWLGKSCNGTQGFFLFLPKKVMLTRCLAATTTLLRVNFAEVCQVSGVQSFKSTNRIF